MLHTVDSLYSFVTKSLTSLAIIVSAILQPAVLVGQALEQSSASEPSFLTSVSRPARLVALESALATTELPAADDALMAPLRFLNRDSNQLADGVTRLLDEELRVELTLGRSPNANHGTLLEIEDGAFQWGYRLRIDDSYRIRLRLASVDLPPGSRLWVHGGDEIVGPFGTELAGPDGVLWTPSVAGPEIALELIVPLQGASVPRATMRVEGVLQQFELDANQQPLLLPGSRGVDFSCLLDAKCFDTGDFAAINATKRATARLSYIKNGSSFLCTGHLINDTVEGSFIPYMLTANHCFDTASSAASLEAFFDYEATSCQGLPPSLNSVPRVNGSTLLATTDNNDMTFIRLSSSPGGRVFLGWTATEPAGGTTLYRVSHPDGLHMSYSENRVVSNPSGICQSLPTSHYHYSDKTRGSTAGGSSGGALVNSQGQIVGQLLGACGPNVSENCDPRNRSVDGKFSRTLPLIRQWLNPDSGGGNTCTPNLNGGVACLRDGRFRVTAEWTNFANPPVTQPIILTPVEDINATGGFQNNPTGIQVVVRIANACNVTGTYWAWLGGFTDAGWRVTFEDLQTGKSRTFQRNRASGDFPTTARDIATFNCN